METAMNQALATYRSTQVTSASPETLILMLYRGALKQVRSGLKALEAGQVQEASDGLVKAQDIIVELRTSLNPQAGDLTTNLASLYEYVHDRLLVANIRKEAPPAQEALRVLEGLTEAWMEMVRSGAKS